MSLTSAFDMKLKSLLIPSGDSVDVEEKHEVVKTDDEQTADAQTYRDPSLHRSLERRSQHITEKHVSPHHCAKTLFLSHSSVTSRP